jgi:hypothetical protein
LSKESLAKEQFGAAAVIAVEGLPVDVHRRALRLSSA